MVGCLRMWLGLRAIRKQATFYSDGTERVMMTSTAGMITLGPRS